LRTFARNQFDKYCEMYMDVLEEKADTLYFKKILDAKYERANGYVAYDPEHNLNWYRLKRLANKIYQTRGIAKNKAIEYIKRTEVYSKLDSSLQLTKRIEHLKSQSEDMVVYFSGKVVNPVVNFVACTYSAGRDMVLIAIDFVEHPNFDDLFEFLKTRYSEVKDMTFGVYNNTLKITLKKESFSKYGHQLKMEVEKLLNEIKTMDFEKAKNITNMIYSDAVNALRARRGVALAM